MMLMAVMGTMAMSMITIMMMMFRSHFGSSHMRMTTMMMMMMIRIAILAQAILDHDEDDDADDEGRTMRRRSPRIKTKWRCSAADASAKCPRQPFAARRTPLRPPDIARMRRVVADGDQR